MDTQLPDSQDNANPSGLAPGGFSRVGAMEEASRRIVDTAPRLKKRKEFVLVADGGLKAVASTLVVQGRLAREGEEIKVGFTVTKKNGNAVVRNRIRRRLRAAVAENIQRYGAPGWDFVVIGRHTALAAPYDIIVRDLRYALRKVGKTPSTPSQVSQAPEKRT